MEEELQTDAASTYRVRFRTSMLPRQDQDLDNNPEAQESEGSEGDTEIRNWTIEIVLTSFNSFLLTDLIRNVRLFSIQKTNGNILKKNKSNQDIKGKRHIPKWA